MNKIDIYILDILADDIESLEIIEIKLNGKGVADPKRNFYFTPDKYYVKNNHNKLFKRDEIIESINRLLGRDFINLRIPDPNNPDSLIKVNNIDFTKINDSDAWFGLNDKGKKIIRNGNDYIWE